MSQPRTQFGHIFESHGSWHIRYNVHENGVRKQRSTKLCAKDDKTPTNDTPSLVELAYEFMTAINKANAANDAQPGHDCPICGNRCKRTIDQKFAPQV